MATSAYQKISEILHTSNLTLARPIKNLRLLDDIERHCHQFFPDLPRQTYKPTRLNNGCLCISAEHASAATLLRYQSGKLLSYLRQQKHLHGLSSVEVDILPRHSKKIITKPKKDLPGSSSDSIQVLADLANSLDNHALSTSLKNLHNTLSKTVVN